MSGKVVFGSRFANHGFHITVSGKEVGISFSKSFYSTENKEVIEEIRRLINEGKLKDVTEMSSSSHAFNAEDQEEIKVTVKGNTYKTKDNLVVQAIMRLLSEKRFEVVSEKKCTEPPETVSPEKNSDEIPPTEEQGTQDESGKTRKKGK